MSQEKTFTSVLQIRLPLHLRNQFNKAAEKNKKTPSRLIRDFIRSYIKENSDQ